MIKRAQELPPQSQETLQTVIPQSEATNSVSEGVEIGSLSEPDATNGDASDIGATEKIIAKEQSETDSSSPSKPQSDMMNSNNDEAPDQTDQAPSEGETAQELASQLVEEKDSEDKRAIEEKEGEASTMAIENEGKADAGNGSDDTTKEAHIEPEEEKDSSEKV